MAVVRYRDPVTGKLVPLRVLQGDDGEQTFVRFSEYADGTDMSETWDDKRDYMGIGFGMSAPTDKSAYQWVRISHFPNGMTLDADNNLHVKGEVTFGADNFSPRVAVDEQKEYTDKRIREHTITADRVSDLTEFMEEYKNANIATGWYVGTGQCGEEHPNQLTLPFAPKAMMIVSKADNDFAIITFPNKGEPAESAKITFYGYGFHGTAGVEYAINGWACRVLDSGNPNKLVWFNDAIFRQFNSNGSLYRYIAFR